MDSVEPVKPKEPTQKQLDNKKYYESHKQILKQKANDYYKNVAKPKRPQKKRIVEAENLTKPEYYKEYRRIIIEKAKAYDELMKNK